MQITLSPELLLQAYSQGLFPMADSAQAETIYMISPKMRGQLSIKDIHIPRSLRKTVRRRPFDIRINQDFESVIRECAKSREGRDDTWINKEIMRAFCALHEQGYAHSIETYQDDQLVGGLYGMALGGAFFGESMFSIATDSSKVALIHLVARLWKAKFSILDTQFTNEHLEQFGVYEILYGEYLERLKPALEQSCNFLLPGVPERQIIVEYLQFREHR